MGYNHQRLAEILFNSEHECGNENIFSDEEKALIVIIHWARNKRIGLEAAIKYHWVPGPHGFKDKKGWWWPFPPEGCDFPVSHVSNEFGTQLTFDPWARWKHCLSLDHCKYLVKHRKTYIVGLGFAKTDLNIFVRSLLINKVPLLMNSSYWEINEFVSDYFKGKILDWSSI